MIGELLRWATSICVASSSHYQGVPFLARFIAIYANTPSFAKPKEQIVFLDMGFTFVSHLRRGPVPHSPSRCRPLAPDGHRVHPGIQAPTGAKNPLKTCLQIFEICIHFNWQRLPMLKNLKHHDKCFLFSVKIQFDSLEIPTYGPLLRQKFRD